MSQFTTSVSYLRIIKRRQNAVVIRQHVAQSVRVLNELRFLSEDMKEKYFRHGRSRKCGLVEYKMLDNVGDIT